MKNTIYLWRSVMCFSFSTQFPDNIGCRVPQGSQLRLNNPWLGLWFLLLLPRCPAADGKHQPIPSHVISFSWLFASEIQQNCWASVLNFSFHLIYSKRSFCRHLSTLPPQRSSVETHFCPSGLRGEKKASHFQCSLSLDGARIFSGLK